MIKVHALVSKQTNRISLVQGHDYIVIGFGDSHIRIIDEAGEPSLYPRDYFMSTEEDAFGLYDLDLIPPDDCVLQTFEDGEFTCDPPELSQRGFYERYADRNSDARKAFEDYVRRLGG